MKTPMQRLKEILLNHREYNLRNFQESTSNSEGYEARLFLCEDILDSIDSYFLEREKEIIINAFEDGLAHYPNDSDPRYSINYYDKNFNTKEQ